MNESAIIRSGRFKVDPEQEAIARMVKRLRESDDDWTQEGGYIAVKCWDDPTRFNIVVAKIVHESEEVCP